MFWDKWIPAKYAVKSEVCAVEISFSEEGKVYHVSHLRNKDKKLELVGTSTSSELNLPKSIVKNKVPLIIIVNGKGVIQKKITFSENNKSTLEEIVRENLPAIHAEEFFIDLYRQENGVGYLSLCRKDHIDALLFEFRKNNYEIAAVFLGSPSVIGLQPLWGSFNSIATSLHQVELTNNYLDTLSPKIASPEELIQIEDLSFHPRHTLGFATSLSYFMQHDIKESNALQIQELPQRHAEKNKFKFLMAAAVCIAFVVAIINVLFYTSFFDQNNKLETELSVYQGKYEQINKLLEDYQKNKSLIEGAGVLNGNKLSEYADRIGKTIPDEVTLGDLYFNPKNEDEDSEDSLVTFKTKSLILKGNCSKSFIVNEWINVLKMQKFIKDVSLEKFVYNNQGMLPNFEIKLVTE